MSIAGSRIPTGPQSFSTKHSWKPFTRVPYGIDVSTSEIGLDAIAGVPPGGHFFGAEHTLQRYRTAFYEPVLFDRSNFEQWSDDGSLAASQRANTLWKKVLADFGPPPLDTAIVEELENFVTRRKGEGGALPGS